MLKKYLYKLLKIYHSYILHKLKGNDKVTIGKGNILLNGFGLFMRNPIEERKYLTIGNDNSIACKMIFERDKGLITIGDRNYMGKGTILISANGIEIGNDVIMAWGVITYDHNSHSIYWDKRKNDIPSFRDEYNTAPEKIYINKDWSSVKSAKIKICDKAWIGFDAVIMKGVTIGEGSVVSSRSVVVEDVPPYTVVGGNPAKVIKQIQ